MKNSNKLIAILLLSTITLFTISCKDEAPEEEPQPTPEEKAVPKIEIKNPTKGQMFMSGDTVWMEVHVTHENDLHEFKATITNEATSTEVFSEADHQHGTTLHYEAFWVNDVTTHSDMKFTFTANDHLGESSTEEVHFHCHPKM